MIYILLANGFEEIEALLPLDMLRRAGLSVKTVGIGTKTPVGSHGIPVVCDITPEEIDLNCAKAVIFPGGMPGATNLDSSSVSDLLIDAVTKNGGIIAAICAAPLVLGRRGLLRGKRATCYPGFEEELIGATVTGRGVERDGNIVTAKGMGAALPFAKTLITMICGKDVSDKISSSIMEEN